jgi:deazaflavin-dependent oxidoreductase (nitroreductase family)
MLAEEYEPSPSARVRDQVALYEATDGREGGTLEGKPVVIVTHRGARSGKIRKTPLMRIEHDGTYILAASAGGAPNHPRWYYNLVAHPVIQVQDGPVIRQMRAREVAGAEKTALWKVADAAWPHFPSYRVAAAPRKIPLLVLEAA